MKYGDLLAVLQTFTPEQLNCDLVLMDNECEFYPAELVFNEDDDRLDDGHPFFCVAD